VHISKDTEGEPKFRIGHVTLTTPPVRVHLTSIV